LVTGRLVYQDVPLSLIAVARVVLLFSGAALRFLSALLTFGVIILAILMVLIWCNLAPSQKETPTRRSKARVFATEPLH
jgi:uncharacterized membrane protein (DUF373 family)